MFKYTLLLLGGGFTALILLALIIYLTSMIKGKRIDRRLVKLNEVQLKDLSNFRIANPYELEGSYHKAQLHTHTNLSDGRISPAELVNLYKQCGYSYLAITDHDRITTYDQLDDQDFITISGEEMTQPRPFRPLGYHLQRLFVKDGCKGRGKLQQKIDWTHSRQGMVMINHPSTVSGLGTQRWAITALINLTDICLIEIVNHFSSEEKNLSYWHALLKHFGPDRPIWGVASDDTHRKEDIDRDWIMVKTKNICPQSLQRALTTGAFYATQGPLLDFAVARNSITVTSQTPVTFFFIDAKQHICQQENGTTSLYSPTGREGFIRIEALAQDSDKKAWSQPFWLIDHHEKSDRSN